MSFFSHGTQSSISSLRLPGYNRGSKWAAGLSVRVSEILPKERRWIPGQISERDRSISWVSGCSILSLTAFLPSGVACGQVFRDVRALLKRNEFRCIELQNVQRRDQRVTIRRGRVQFPQNSHDFVINENSSEGIPCQGDTSGLISVPDNQKAWHSVVLLSVLAQPFVQLFAEIVHPFSHFG